MFGNLDEDFTLFPSGQMNVSFPNVSLTLDEDGFDGSPNEESQLTFQSASQFLDIDLIDYHEITTDPADCVTDLSLIDSYFRSKSSTLEALSFTPVKSVFKVPGAGQAPPTSLCDSPLRLLDDEYCLPFDQSSSSRVDSMNTDLPSTISSCPSPRSSCGATQGPICPFLDGNGKVYPTLAASFTLARFTVFDFDFLRLTNHHTDNLLLQMKYVLKGGPAEALSFAPSSSTLASALRLPPGETVPKLARAIPLVTGKFCVQIYCFPLQVKKRAPKSSGAVPLLLAPPPIAASALSPFILNCHLHVIDVFLHRRAPLSHHHSSHSDGPPLIIQLDTFKSGREQLPPVQVEVLFPMIANIHLHRPFILKLTLKQPSSSSSSVSGHSPLITFAGDPQFLSSSSSASRESSTITHLSSSSQGNSDTCFISMRQPSDFKLTLQINSLPGNVAEDVSQLLLYACNSLNWGDTKEMEAKEAKKGETLDESGKVYKLFDYQIKVKSYPKAQLEASAIQSFLGANEQINGSQWRRIDLRNRDSHRLVHVKLSLKVNDVPVEAPVWKCTRSAFTVRPLAKERLHIWVSQETLEGALKDKTTAKNDDQDKEVEEEEEETVDVCLVVRQFAGLGGHLTSRLHLRWAPLRSIG